MKRLFVISLVIFAGLTVCALLVLRHAARTASPAPGAVQPVDQLQGSVKLDRHPDYRLDAATKAQLRREEMRQRPWEGRN